jgi:LDH2 family malate/lactate/ureidoglycolate dehydrogenase
MGGDKNSNHFGIAGYYAMMALKHDMIGICLTMQTARCSHFSISRMMGTNPVAVAIPAMSQPPFVADFATTPIARGKLAVSEKKVKRLPWVLSRTVPAVLLMIPGYLRKAINGHSCGDRLHGSHKGYCLSAIVDIFRLF